MKRGMWTGTLSRHAFGFLRMSMNRSSVGSKLRKLLPLLLCSVLLVACSSGSGGSTGGSPPPGSSFAAQFDFLWQTFDEQYPYFVHKNIDWNALRNAYRPRAAQAATQQELMDIIREMLANLHDQHVFLTSPTGSQTPASAPGRFINFDRTVWQQQYVSRMTGVRTGQAFTSGTLSGAAYIAVESWDSSRLTIGELDTALEDFRNASSIIIDVRNNPGGNDALALQFAGRFADRARTCDFFQFRNGPAHTDFGPLQERQVSPRGAWQFTRSVFLLIGRRSASSSENFIMAMKELPNVTLIGDTTAGSSGNPGVFGLNGGWSFTVSRWINFNAQMQIIEDVGIDPEIRIAASPADFAAGRDPVLDFAINQASSP